MSVALHSSWDSALALANPIARERIKEFIPSAEQTPFVQFALTEIDKAASSASAIAQTGILIPIAIDPALSDLPDAIRLAKASEAVEKAPDVKILQLAADSNDAIRIMRALEIVDAISDCRRLVIPLLKFAKLPDQNIRSKAIKLMARASQNGAWLTSILNDRDPRVRSNVIEGLFDQLGRGAESFLRTAAKDPHHRVSVTALLCLARLGDESSRAQIENLTGDDRELHARAATWALKQLESKTNT